MRVVIVQQVGGDRIDEGRAHRIQPRALAEHRRHRRAAESPHHPQRRQHRRVARRAQRAADMVEDRALGFMPQRGRDVAPVGAGDEAAERLGGGGVGHRACLVVPGPGRHSPSDAGCQPFPPSPRRPGRGMNAGNECGRERGCDDAGCSRRWRCRPGLRCGPAGLAQPAHPHAHPLPAGRHHGHPRPLPRPAALGRARPERGRGEPHRRQRRGRHRRDHARRAGWPYHLHEHQHADHPGAADQAALRPDQRRHARSCTWPMSATSSW